MEVEEGESRQGKESPTTWEGDSSSLPSTISDAEMPSVLCSEDYRAHFSDESTHEMEEVSKSKIPLVGDKDSWESICKIVVSPSPTDMSSGWELSPAGSTDTYFDGSSQDSYGTVEYTNDDRDEITKRHIKGSASKSTALSFNNDSMQGQTPIVGYKEPLSNLAAEFQSGNPIILEKIKLLGKKYSALRRTRGDGNCFYRSFMFSYLEHILVTQDREEVSRVLVEIAQCSLDLQNLGYAEFTYEDFFASFTDLLQNCLQGTEVSLSLDQLLEKACETVTSDCAVMFLRFVTSAAIQKRAEFFEPFISGISDVSVVQFCKKSVEPMGEESEEVHIIAVCDALGVPIRVVYLDRSSSGHENPTANHHDFFPSANDNESNSVNAANVSIASSEQVKRDPFVTLLYRPGHYDILYPI